jgi:hypothetical protein
VLAGCGDPYSNRWFEEDELFTSAVPVSGDLVSDTPERDASGARELGQDARAVTFTHVVVREVNRLNAWLLGRLDAVVAREVTTREEDRRIWGPYSWPGRFGRAARLTVERIDDEAFLYVLSGQDASPAEVVEDGWVPILRGRFDRVGDLRDGSGIFTYDAGAVAQLSGTDATGTMTSEYVRAEGFISLYSEFQNWSDGTVDARDWDYYFERYREGGGLFEFNTEAEVVGGPNSALEGWRLRTRWNSDKSGRADAWVIGGDLAGRVPSVECWDTSGARTYYRVGPRDAPIEQEGRPVDCVLDEELPRDTRGDRSVRK